MLKKLKRILSLSIVTAMIMSLVGVLPVMAEEAGPELEPGIYSAKYYYVNSDGKQSEKIGMFATCQSAAVVVKEDGSAYAQLIFWEDTTYATNTLDGVKFVKNLLAVDYSETDESLADKKTDAPSTLDKSSKYTDVVKVFNVPLDKAKIKTSVTDTIGKNTYNNAWQLKLTYLNGSNEWSTGKYGDKKTAGYEAYIVLGSSLNKISALPTKQPAPTQTNATELKATILRTDGVSEEYINTDFGKSRYRITSVKNVANGPTIATVQLDGNFHKYYPGSKKDAETAKNASKIVELENTNKQINLEFNYLKDKKTQTFCLYSDSMEKWIQYSISFEEGHSFNEGFCVNCGLIDSTNEDLVKTTETSVNITNKAEDKAVISASNNSIAANKELSVETKTGKVVFDKEAVNSILSGLTTKATFEMKDTTTADSKYDIVIELGFKDEAGNNVFAEGTAKGKATITVPYAKEVAEGKTVKVFYINGDEKEEVEATYDAEAKTIAFTVAHFSTYAVEQVDKPVESKTEKEPEETAPNTGDSSMMLMYISLMLLASFGIAYSVKANRA